MATNSLISYSAPTADNTTFYVSTLDSTATHGTAGAFAGASSTQGDVSYSAITRIYNVSASSAASWFQFYTVTSTDGDNSTGNEIVGADESTTAAFTSITSGVSNSNTSSDRNALQKDFVDTLAEHVFGSREAADLFSNQQAIKSAWDTAEAAAVTAANATVNDTTANAKAASKELVEAMLVNHHDRFALQYNAAFDTGTTSFATGTTSDITPTTTGSGSGAKVTVTMVDSTTIGSISIHDSGSDSNPPITGSGYAAGDDLTISDGNGNAIKIASLNSVQAAMLNGTLDDSSNPTNPPLEAGDKIRIKLGINSASGQKNTANQDVSFRQSYYVDYHLS